MNQWMVEDFEKIKHFKVRAEEFSKEKAKIFKWW